MPAAVFRALPDDATLLPLASGRLLVSRGHAVFCRVPAACAGDVDSVLAGARALDGLGASLLGELDRHGFFGPPRPPLPTGASMQLQLTNACNLGCAYCCTNSGRPRAHELGYAELVRVVDEVPHVLGPRTHVGLLGGEPLLVPWALDLAGHVLDRGLQLTLFTNGLRLREPQTARAVAAVGQRGATVRVSLGGPDAALCDEASGGPRFEAVIAGLHELSRHGGSAQVDLMLLPQHVATAARELPRVRRRLPQGTRLTLGLLYESGRERGEHVFGSPAELEAALDRVVFEAGVRIAAPRREPLASRREGCGCALGRHLHVRSDGRLFACFRMEEPVGRLNGGGLEAVVAGLRASARPAARLEPCRECALNTLCGGGCRSENVRLTGDGDRPLCGPWRVRVLAELLAEDLVGAVEWPAARLLAEARARGIDAPERLIPVSPSRHLTDT